LAQHAARGVQARQQRVHAGLFERPGGARRNVAGDDLHSASSTLPSARAVEQALGPAREAALLHGVALRGAVAAERERDVGAARVVGQQRGDAPASSACQASAQPAPSSRRADTRSASLTAGAAAAGLPLPAWRLSTRRCR
jgi:hypothetical protein